jgi:hypothetical protein
MKGLGFAAVAFAMMACAGITGPARAGGTLTPVLVSGRPAPGAAGGVTIDSVVLTPIPSFYLPLPTINAAGEVVVSGALRGDGVTSANAHAMWAGAPGQLQLVARTGDPAPGLPAGVKIGEFTGPAGFNESGVVALAATLTGTGVAEYNNRAVWSGKPGALGLVLRQGSQAPGLPAGVVAGYLSDPVINASGTLAVRGMLDGDVTPENSEVIWSGPANGLRPVARIGSPAPGAEPATWWRLYEHPTMNAKGQVLFGGELGGSVPHWYGGLWLADPDGGPPRPVMVTDAPVPGQGGDLRYSATGTPPSLNEHGQVAFATDVLRAGSNQGAWAVLVGSADDPRVAAMDGMHPPGTPAGTTFNYLVSRVLIDASGRAAFYGGISGPGRAGGIWRGTADALELVAYTGEAAPGMPDGVVFDGLGEPVISPSGLIAFNGYTTAGDGIWAGEPGALVSIVRTGDLLDVGGGDLRQVSLAELAREGALNDAGQLVFRAQFTDGGSGVFLAIVPEPTAVGVIATAGIVGCIRRKRERP